RPYVEHLPEARADESYRDRFGSVAQAHHTLRILIDGGSLRERAGVVAQLGVPEIADVVGDALGAVGARASKVDPADAVRVRHERGGAEQETVEDLEHGRVRADPEREREREGSAEAGRATKLSHGVAQVVAKRIETLDHRQFLLTMFGGSKQLWTNLIQHAEPAKRLGVGLRAREPRRDERIRARGEMESDLVVGLGFDATASERQA